MVREAPFHREDHRGAGLVAGLNGFVVVDASAGLYDGLDAFAGGGSGSGRGRG